MGFIVARREVRDVRPGAGGMVVIQAGWYWRFAVEIDWMLRYVLVR
jgi:hypothetical protein